MCINIYKKVKILCYNITLVKVKVTYRNNNRTEILKCLILKVTFFLKGSCSEAIMKTGRIYVSCSNMERRNEYLS